MIRQLRSQSSTCKNDSWFFTMPASCGVCSFRLPLALHPAPKGNRRRFIHIAADQKQIALTRSAAELARKTVDAVERRVQAAKSPDAELYRARAALTRSEIELLHAEHELLTSRHKLAAQLNLRRALRAGRRKDPTGKE